MALIQDRAVYLNASGLNKTLEQAIIDGDLSGGGGGGGATEIFATEIVIGSSAATITGLLHFRSPSAKTITGLVVQIYEKNGIATGILEVDIKKNSSPDDVGMTSIFTTKPVFDFAVVSDYATDTGTRSTSAIASGEFLRIDLTSIPAGFKGTLYVSCYA